MAKATMQSSKALQMGFGIQSGIVKVMPGSVFRLIQRTKGDGSLVTPMCALTLNVTKCGSDLQPINEEDTEEKDLIYCWGSKEVGDDGNHTFAFHPAIGKNATDNDPEDQGAEIGAAGNTLVPTGNSSAPFGDSEVNLFAKALELKGWKPEINDQCYSPNYDGAVFEVETVTKADLCKQFGIRYKGQEGRDASKGTVWNITKIHVYPYEKKGTDASASKNAKGQAGTTSMSVSVATSPSKGNGLAEGGTLSTETKDGADLLAYSTVQKVAAQKEFKGKEGVARSKFQAAVMTQLHRDKKAKEQQAVMKLVKDDDWIVNAGADLAFTVDTDEGVMNFITD